MTKCIRILLAEDEYLIALCLTEELRNAGYEVCRHVVTGEEAISSAEKDKPDIILMDIRLAGTIDGIEAAGKIMASLTVPIFFMTGYLDKTYRDRAACLHPAGFFTKPLSIQDISKALQALPQ